MGRGLFQWFQSTLRGLRGRSGPRQRFSDADIILVALWAVLHDRPISWACVPGHWPPARFRRRLPDQSTMSRRLRTVGVRMMLGMLLEGLARLAGPCRAVVLDGRALELSCYTRDPHAANGRGRGGFARGYRLMALVDARDGRVVRHLLVPMNVAESVAARVLLRQAAGAGLLAPGALVLADANFDSNPLHRHAEALGLTLLAPRRRPGTGLGWSAVGGHHRNRLLSIALTEQDAETAACFVSVRSRVERAFSRQVCTGGGLRELPAWVRTLPRVRVHVALKLLLHAARQHLQRTLAA